jgi:uncharacterized protein (TIGR04255 family)
MTLAALPAVPPFRLRRAALVQVLCQVRFSPVLRLRQDDAVIPFQEAVRDRYPRYAKQEGVGFLITPGGVLPQQPAQAGLHRFHDTAEAFAITLAPDFVALETSAYTDIDDFAGRLVDIVGVIQKLYAPAEIVRLGLRFTNELRFSLDDPIREATAALNPLLLGPVGSAELSSAVRVSEQVIELADGPKTVLVRHGLHREGTTVMMLPGLDPRSLSELSRPFYLLDIDAFVQDAVPFSVEGVDARLRDFNEDLRALFAWSVDPAYRRQALGEDDGGS